MCLLWLGTTGSEARKNEWANRIQEGGERGAEERKHRPFEGSVGEFSDQSPHHTWSMISRQSQSHTPSSVPHCPLALPIHRFCPTDRRGNHQAPASFCSSRRLPFRRVLSPIPASPPRLRRPPGIHHWHTRRASPRQSFPLQQPPHAPLEKTLWLIRIKHTPKQSIQTPHQPGLKVCSPPAIQRPHR